MLKFKHALVCIYLLLVSSLGRISPSRLSLCSKWLTKHQAHDHHNSSHAFSSLRDAVQIFQHMLRRIADLESLIHHQKNVFPKITNISDPANAAMLKAFATPLSLEDLSVRLQEAHSRQHNATIQMQDEMKRLISAGLLRQEALTTTPHDLSPCVLGKLNTSLFDDRPVVSFMLQYYKRPWMIGQIVDRIKSCSKILPVELLVNVDEPSSAADWAQIAANSSGLVVPVFSANIHEIRAYNRLADLARGRYLITHQDDELLPLSCAWIKDVVSFMDRHMHVGALGMKSFIWADLPCCDSIGMAFRDPALDDFKVQFVSNVDFSPMLIQQTAFKDVGGLDEGLSDLGECGIVSDYEFSLRLWARGWTVAYHRLENREADNSGHLSGTHGPETAERCWGRQQRSAAYSYQTRWREDFRAEVLAKVRILNHKLLVPIFLKCPFGFKYGGCSEWEKDNYTAAYKPMTEPGASGV